MLNYYDIVYEVVKLVPRGRVTTYSAIAKYLGNPRASRAVGWAMRACERPDVPCHRVIRADGSIAGFPNADGARVRTAYLKKESIHVSKKGTVSLSRYYFDDFANRKNAEE